MYGFTIMNRFAVFSFCVWRGLRFVHYLYKGLPSSHFKTTVSLFPLFMNSLLSSHVYKHRGLLSSLFFVSLPSYVMSNKFALFPTNMIIRGPGRYLHIFFSVTIALYVILQAVYGEFTGACNKRAGLSAAAPLPSIQVRWYRYPTVDIPYVLYITFFLP